MRILVAAPTNSAVDSILMKLDEDPEFCEKYSVVRTGPMMKVCFGGAHIDVPQLIASACSTAGTSVMHACFSSGSVSSSVVFSHYPSCHAVGGL